MNQREKTSSPSIASNGRTIPIIVATNNQDHAQKHQQHQGHHQHHAQLSRRRSISLVEDGGGGVQDNIVKVDPDATPVVTRRATGPSHQQRPPSRPSSYFFTDELDKMANDIINNQFPKSTTSSKVTTTTDIITDSRKKSSEIVRRTSSGYR